MTERTPGELRRILREKSRNINYEELSEEESDKDEELDEVDDIQDAGEDTSLVNTRQIDLEDDLNEEEDQRRPGRRRSVVKGRNDYKWCNIAPETRGRRSLKVYLPKVNGEAKNVKTPLEAWSLLFSPQLLEIVVEHTNEEIRRRHDGLDQTHCQETNVVEIKALLGLLYFCGMEKQNHTCTEDLWAPRFGSNLYRAVMQRHRFHYLLACLRFDDKTTRAERRAVHKLAPIKEIWDIFISNCTQYYSPSTYCTIDEQLLNFRGRFGAKKNIPNKPDKYGIKIVFMNDVETSYLISAEPYVGRVTTLKNDETVPSYYVRKLSESIYHTERNITCDNCFMSLDLVRTMKNNYGLTLVGIMRKNKREIQGIDTFDQMCHAYTTARVTLRWPLRLFFGMLDHAGINSIILYNLQASNAALNRRNFIKELSFALVEPHLKSRLQLPTLRASLRIMIREILEVNPEPTERTSKLQKRKRCSFCSNDKKTSYCCARCENPICEEHRLCICGPCIGEM